MAEILVAEDDSALAHTIRRILEGLGHAVTLTQDGGEALGALSAQHYDMLLADIQMPVMDGIGLALKASEERPDMPIVLMTAFADAAERAHNLDALIQSVLLKPFSAEKLRQTVGAVLEPA